MCSFLVDDSSFACIGVAVVVNAAINTKANFVSSVALFISGLGGNDNDNNDRVGVRRQMIIETMMKDAAYVVVAAYVCVCTFFPLPLSFFSFPLNCLFSIIKR